MVEVQIKAQFNNNPLVTTFRASKSSTDLEIIINDLQRITQDQIDKLKDDLSTIESIEKLYKNIRSELTRIDSVQRIVSIKMRHQTTGGVVVLHG